MDIPAISMAMAQNKIMDSVSIAMLDKAIDLNEGGAAELLSAMDHSMELSVNPNIGANFDVSV